MKNKDTHMTLTLIYDNLRSADIDWCKSGNMVYSLTMVVTNHMTNIYVWNLYHDWLRVFTAEDMHSLYKYI